MSKPYKDLQSKMSAKQRTESAKLTKQMLSEIALCELRQSLKLTQNQVAESLQIKQPSLAKIEKQNDMFISTLARIINALGGKLKIIAAFPDQEVLLAQFTKQNWH